MKRLFAAAFFLFLAPAAAPAPAPTLILISLDGFRAGYLDRKQAPALMPNLLALARTGVRAKGMTPSFPTLTYPNHYTLVTGLRPDRHGVVDNVMTDPAIGPDRFTMNSRTGDDGRWWEGGKPLWVSAQEQGRITAAAGWPGSDRRIHGRRATYLDPWRAGMEPDEVASLALAWLGLPARQRPSLLFLYFADVDHEGHVFGPGAAQTDAALRRVDAAVGRLVAGLKARGLYAHTNIVLVSDHGMTDTPAGQHTVIDDLVPPSLGIVRTAASAAGIDALPGHEAEVARILLAPHAHFTCWRKEDIPAHLHYGRHPRVPQFYCLNVPGWRFALAADVAAGKTQNPGNHGYDPRLPDMQALFLAHGPAFRKGATLAPFDNVHVYPLLARLSGVTPQDNDGDSHALDAALSR